MSICKKCGKVGSHKFPCETVKLIFCQGNNYDLRWGGYDKSAISIGKVNLVKTNSTLYISDFIVNRLYRRQGFGSRMIKEIERLANQKQCNKLKLLVLPENDIAIALYEKNGFQLVGMKEKYKTYEKPV